VVWDTREFLYGRVAHDDSFALEHQRFLLQLYVKQAGYTIIGAADEYGSGLTLDRPVLQEVNEAVIAGRGNVVIVHSLTRIGREWGMPQNYLDLLTHHKVKAPVHPGSAAVRRKRCCPNFDNKKCGVRGLEPLYKRPQRKSKATDPCPKIIQCIEQFYGIHFQTDLFAATKFHSHSHRQEREINLQSLIDCLSQSKK